MKEKKKPSRKSKGSLLFLVDGMLGSIATKLRILGFDTVYDKESEDNDLLSRAKQENRILITSDYELQLKAKRLHLHCVLISGKTERERLVELFSKLNIRQVSLNRMARCSVCNGTLKKKEVRDHYGRDIYQCTTCGKLFWKGSHWKKLNALFSQVNFGLMQERR